MELLCGNDTLGDDVYESECRPGCCLDGSGGEVLKRWLQSIVIAVDKCLRKCSRKGRHDQARGGDMCQET